jgi:hypothetical protein
MAVSDWSTTAASNVLATTGVNFDEGQTPGSVNNSAREMMAQLRTYFNASDALICNGRLTLTTALAVTTSDVTAATTLYFTPYKGNGLALYDGSANWKLYAFSELSIAVPATTVTMYDVFVYDNAGTPTLELTAWTNDTTRATALVLQNGVLVKTGATTRRYLGSFRTTGVFGQTEDSKAKRFVWNMYNRRVRFMQVLPTVDSYTYTTATIRQMNADTANQLDFVRGLDEDAVHAWGLQLFSNTNAGQQGRGGIGLDATNAFNGQIGLALTPVANYIVSIPSRYSGFPGVGRHFLSLNEHASASGTGTFYGDNGGPTLQQAGISGEVWA